MNKLNNVLTLSYKDCLRMFCKLAIPCVYTIDTVRKWTFAIECNVWHYPLSGPLLFI